MMERKVAAQCTPYSGPTLLVALVLFAAPVATACTQGAFPTAEGYGAQAVGGLGGRVIEVTTLANSDQDGMPDAWKTAQGLDPNDAGDGPKAAANGYTHVENYLNELASEARLSPNQDSLVIASP
ncbi:MAG TPA: hypothetical protein PK640_08750 [Verrucomicrobiota bacterium]|nr:hypothetical protein [Verrucomicrobiota bacterium]